MGGMECLFNGASESEWDNCHVRNNLNQAQTSFHHEQYGFLIILGYVALGVAVNAFLIQVLTRASASLMYTTVALAVPIAFIVLEVYQYEQPHSDWITDLIGLISLLFGLALYRSEMVSCRIKKPTIKFLTLGIGAEYTCVNHICRRNGSC